MEQRKAEYKAMFRDVYNWLLGNCELRKDSNFFIAAAGEMRRMSGDGSDPLKNALLTAVYTEFDRLAAQEAENA